MEAYILPLLDTLNLRYKYFETIEDGQGIYKFVIYDQHMSYQGKSHKRSDAVASCFRLFRKDNPF